MIGVAGGRVGADQQERYYEQLAALELVPRWTSTPAHEPIVPERPHLWRWRDVEPVLRGAATFIGVDDDGGDRRVLALRNPGSQPTVVATTHSIATTFQLLMPGEVAPVHRHSIDAVRFVLAGEGAFTVVDGVRLAMEPGDLVLTPSGAWHDHGHQGTEPVVWLDCLSAPLVASLRSRFVETQPGVRVQPVDVCGDDAAMVAARMAPADDPRPPRPQLLRFPWSAAYESTVAAPAGTDGSLVEYVDPVTGQHVLKTLACYLQVLGAGCRTVPRRETSSSVCLVVRGAGEIIVDGAALTVERNDVVAVPSWTWYEATADGSDELVIYRVSDRPVHDALGLYRTERHVVGSPASSVASVT